MNNLIFGGATVFAIFTLFYFIYKEGGDNRENKIRKEQQEIEIKIQKDIVEETKQVLKRRTENKSKLTGKKKDGKIDWSDSNTNLGWLRKNRCKDCKGG